MSEYIFLFDMDSTITKEEVLPTIAQKCINEKFNRSNNAW